MSYYRQSGVDGGLVRSINPGMSSRVKTSAEYENTRLNNAEFKTATSFAASILQGIQPSYRPMFNLFKNAKLSKSVLSILKSNSGAWGKRIITKTNRASVCDSLRMLAKNNVANLVNITMGGYSSADHTQNVVVSPSASFASILSSYGADGAAIRLYALNVYEGVETPGIEGIKPNITRLGSLTTGDISVGTPEDVDVDVPELGVELSLMTGRVCEKFYAVVILPYREIGGDAYTLQEACTFAVFPDPEQDQD